MLSNAKVLNTIYDESCSFFIMVLKEAIYQKLLIRITALGCLGWILGVDLEYINVSKIINLPSRWLNSSSSQAKHTSQQKQRSPGKTPEHRQHTEGNTNTASTAA